MPYADKDKQREYQRKWIAQRKAEFFEGKMCAICSSAEGLELDHIDDAQKVCHRVWSWSEVRRSAELAKCQVLCGPCHLEKSRSHGDFSRKGGTRAMPRTDRSTMPRRP